MTGVQTCALPILDLVCATIGITDERARRVAFSRPYFHTRLLVVVRDGLGEEAMSEKAFLDEVRKSADSSLLVGEITKPEAISTVAFKNAVSRFREMGFLAVEAHGKREKTISRGPEYLQIRGVVETLRQTLPSQVDE